jgi:hypothetical protein
MSRFFINSSNRKWRENLSATEKAQGTPGTAEPQPKAEARFARGGTESRRHIKQALPISFAPRFRFAVQQSTSNATSIVNINGNDLAEKHFKTKNGDNLDYFTEKIQRTFHFILRSH